MTELEINFRPDGDSATYVREGFGDVEPYGCWMVGTWSRLVIPPPPWVDGPFVGRMVVGPFIQDGLVAEQLLEVRVNGVPVADWRLTQVAELTFEVPDGVMRPDADNEIVFVHEDAVSPGRTQPGGDMRELALSIWSLVLFGPERPRATPPAPPRAADERPFFHLRSRGNLANRMIEFMVALSVQWRVPHCTVSGVALDEWGLSTRGAVPAWADHAVTDEQAIDLEDIAERLRRPETRKIAYRGYGQRMENFLPVDAYRAIFRAPTENVTVYDERYLVINVRAGDVLAGRVPDYVMIPPRFYRDLIERTRLIPVFVGQLAPNVYTDALRAACPNALFVMSQGPMRDFETIRRARNIVTSVSTFSWLAAWLSHAARIYMPVNGLFNPLQFPPIDLLPLDDSRYEFHLFPVNHAVPPDGLAAAHAALDGGWRVVDGAELAALRRRAEPPRVLARQVELISQ